MAFQRFTRSLPDPFTRELSGSRPLPPLTSVEDSDEESRAASSRSEWQELSANGPTTAVLTLRGVSQLAPFGALVLVPILTSELTPGATACLCLLFATAGAILPGLCHGELFSGLPWVGANGGAIFTIARPILGDAPTLVVSWGLIGDLLIRAALLAKASGRIFDSVLDNVVDKYIARHGFNASYFSIGAQPATPLLSGPDLLGVLFTLVLTCLFASLLVIGVASRLSFFTACVFAAGFVVIACSAFFHSSDGNGAGTVAHHRPPPNASAFALVAPAPPPLPSLAAMLHGTSLALAAYALFDGTAATGAFDGNSETVRLGLSTPAHVMPASSFLAVAVNTVTFILAVLGLSGAGPQRHHPGVAFAALPAVAARHWLHGFTSLVSFLGLVSAFVSTMDTLVHTLSALAVEEVLPRAPLRSVGVGVVVSAAAISLLALVGSDVALLEMAAAGTALSLMTAPVCLLILHYLPSASLLRMLYAEGSAITEASESTEMPVSSAELEDVEEWHRRRVQLRPVFDSARLPARVLTCSPHCLTVLLSLDAIAIGLCAGLGSVYAAGAIDQLWPALVTLGLFVIVTSLLLALYQPVPLRRLRAAFAVPLLPILPLLGVVISAYLAVNLPWVAWARALVFSAIGVLVYALERLRQRYRKNDDPEKF